MKVVILAGGQKSTLSNDQVGIPKPMAEIGGKPMLWHIMKRFAAYGCNEFIICGGYKVDMIKEYFMDYYIYQSDITVDLRTNTVEIHKNRTEDWKVTVVDTGLDTATGSRVAQIAEYVTENDFIVTYGDCLTDLAIDELIAYHRQQGRLATMVVAKPAGRSTSVAIDAEGEISRSSEAIEESRTWASACVYVLSRKVFDVLGRDQGLEQALMEGLADQKQLITYKHYGFWTPVETYRDRVNMEALWNQGLAPWYKD